MSWWLRCVLLALVCAVHISILFAFDLKHHSSAADTPQRTSMHSVVFYTVPTVGVEDVGQRNQESIRARGIKPAELPQALQRALQPVEQLVITPPLFTNSPGGALDTSDFLVADAVDETALPEERFEEILKQSLPLGPQNVELEIWVDNTGNTVLVRCLDQDSCDNFPDSFKQLLTLRFKPAIKNGLSVSSRKQISIHIDPPPTFGL